jgi:glycosyltransferase involved in cell wall biosynthesis
VAELVERIISKKLEVYATDETSLLFQVPLWASIDEGADIRSEVEAYISSAQCMIDEIYERIDTIFIESIAKSEQGVLDDLKKTPVRKVFLVDNNSTDGTGEEARKHGAIVLLETYQGYGAACLKGIAEANAQPEPADVILFLDADHSDDILRVNDLVAPIASNEADMVIGSRALGQRQPGAMTPQQRFGNWLATRMIRVMYRKKFTDLGPFRAIRLTSLNALNMQDRTYGWTVEMQVKAIRQNLRFVEIPVDYFKRRTGKSKVAGTLKGTIFAGYKIIATIIKYS